MIELRFVRTGAVLLFLASASCDGAPAASSSAAGGSGPGGAGHGASTATTMSADASTAATFGAGGMMGTGGGSAANTPLYVHTDTALYTFDVTAPQTPPVMLGTFDCIGGTGQDTSMTDVAVSATGDVWAVSGHYVYSLEMPGGGVVHCANTTSLNTPSGVRFYALTFAPKGVIDASAEVLVAGNSAGELWTIDAAGTANVHGNFGIVPANDGHGHAYANAGKPWELSGDIVFLANSGDPVGFATVRDCPNPPSTTGCSTVDTLIQIDLTKLATATSATVVTLNLRGQIVPKTSCSGGVTGYGSMYGIAALGADVYGFSRKGDIVAIDNVDGSACLLQTIATDKWAGAGVTTLAEVVAPPPS